MAEYQNSGILNANKWKKTAKQPDMTGKATCVCVHCQKTTEFEIAAWDRNRFTTLAFTEKSAAEKRRNDAKAKKAGLPTAESEANQSEMPETAGTGGESEDGKVPF